MAGCDLEIYLSPRQLCDTELICNGGFSPLTGFMTEEEYMSVVENNRLPNGLLFGLPVVYDTDRDDLKPGKGGWGGVFFFMLVRLMALVCFLKRGSR